MKPPTFPAGWSSFLKDLDGDERGEPVALPDEALKRHSLVMGLPGVGKSMLLIILTLVIAIRRVTGRTKGGLCVIDVTTDLFVQTRSRLSLLAARFSELYKLVILIDPTNPNWSVRYNPLELRPGEVPELKAKALTDLIIAVGRDDPSIVVRMKRVAYYTFLALSLSGGTLVDIPRFLADELFREEILASVIGYPDIESFWSSFPKKEREVRELTQSFLNRIEPFVAIPSLKFFFGGPSTINFRELLDGGYIVLVNAPKSPNKLGEEGSYLLCAFLVSAFEQAAYTRDEIPDDQRTLFTLIADEFTQYVTEATIRIVILLRKCALGLVLATQTLKGNPRTEGIINLALQTCDNLISFRISHGDAQILAPELFNPPLDEAKDYRYRSAFDYETVWRPLPEIWEQQIRKITQLPDRMCFWKRRGKAGAKLIETLMVANIRDLPDAQRLPQLLKAQELAAFKLAGVPKHPQPGPSTPLLLSAGQDGQDDDAPLDYSEFYDP
jgi:hypothetical protein